MTRPRRTHRSRAVWAAVAAAVLALGGVAAPALADTPSASESDTASPAPSADAGVFRVATNGFVDSFNPFTSIYLLPTNTLRYVYENLVQYSSKDGSPTAGLAESWETQEDGKQWVFKIREGMEWSDGEPITANDVAWTYTQMMTKPEMASANGSLVSNFSKVTATDDTTLTIDLKAAQAANPGLEIPVVPEHVWSKVSNPAEYANDKDVVGSGPFLLESYKANQSIVLKSNPNFWRGAPKISGIQYIYYKNLDAQVQALRAGEVDFVSGLTAEQYAALDGQPGITVNSGRSRRYTSIGLNAGSETPEERPTERATLRSKTSRSAKRSARPSTYPRCSSACSVVTEPSPQAGSRPSTPTMPCHPTIRCWRSSPQTPPSSFSTRPGGRRDRTEFARRTESVSL